MSANLVELIIRLLVAAYCFLLAFGVVKFPQKLQGKKWIAGIGAVILLTALSTYYFYKPPIQGSIDRALQTLKLPKKIDEAMVLTALNSKGYDEAVFSISVVNLLGEKTLSGFEGKYRENIRKRLCSNPFLLDVLPYGYVVSFVFSEPNASEGSFSLTFKSQEDCR